MPSNKNVNNYFTKDFLIFFGIFIGIINGVLAFKIFHAGYQFIFSMTFLPILCGMYFEQKRLGYSWKEILFKTFGSYCVVSVGLLITTQNQAKNAPIETSSLLTIFIISFISISISYAYYLGKNYRISAKVTEGFLLMQILSVLYLILSGQFGEHFNFLTFTVTAISLIYLFYVFFQGYSKKRHTLHSKLYLSIGSSFCTLFFAMFYFVKVFNMEISEFVKWDDLLLVLIGYFLFGVSIIYTAQNFWLLVRFLRNKSESTEDYKSRLHKLKQEHITRFDDHQLPLSEALLCTLIISGLYFMNYVYNWAPDFTLIWFVFSFFPSFIFFGQMSIQYLKNLPPEK